MTQAWVARAGARWPTSRASALRAVLASILVLALAAPTRAQPRPIDGIVALVGGRTPSPTTNVVLRSDVELRARLALAGRTDGAPSGALGSDLLAATLEQIIGELVIAREAERLHAADPTEAQIARQRDDIVRSVGGDARLRALIDELAIDPAEIDEIARRRAYVDAFLRANLEGSTLISDAQIDETYATGTHPFADSPLDEVREPLRAWLAAAALERDVRRWIEVLRSRTPIRVVVPFAAAAPATGVEEVGTDVGAGE